MKNKKIAITAPLFAAVILFLIPISEKLLKLTAASDSNIITSASVVQLFIFAIPAAFYCKIRGLDFLKQAKVKGVSLSNIPFVIAAACTYFFTAIMILYVESNLLSLPGDTSAAIAASSDLPGIALAYVIVPAIAEELFFRSILISDYSVFGGPVAIGVSALFFAMLHFSFPRLPFYFLLGLILATMTYVTGSSFPAVTVHLIYNASAIYFGGSMGTFLSESSSSVILAFIIVVLFMASLAWMLSSLEDIYERRSILYDMGELPGSRREAASNVSRAGKVEGREEKVSRRVASIFLSPTFFLCVFLFVIITLDII